MNRWEWLLEQKPRTIQEHLLDEVAKLLARELERWPPPVEDLDPVTGGKFAPLLEPTSVRPSRAVYGEAFRLARWELAREVSAVDDYMRNQRFIERGLAPEDRLALLFLSRWLTEQMLAVTEATEGRINRAQLTDCLDRAEGLLRQ